MHEWGRILPVSSLLVSCMYCIAWCEVSVLLILEANEIVIVWRFCYKTTRKKVWFRDWFESDSCIFLLFFFLFFFEIDFRVAHVFLCFIFSLLSFRKCVVQFENVLLKASGSDSISELSRSIMDNHTAMFCFTLRCVSLAQSSVRILFGMLPLFVLFLLGSSIFISFLFIIYSVWPLLSLFLNAVGVLSCLEFFSLLRWISLERKVQFLLDTIFSPHPKYVNVALICSVSFMLEFIYCLANSWANLKVLSEISNWWILERYWKEFYRPQTELFRNSDLKKWFCD